jgi:hypothetical protein
MIKERHLKNGKLVEERFCIPMSKLPLHEMDKDITDLFIHLLGMKNAVNPVPVKELNPLYRQIVQMIELRFTMKLTDWRLITLLMFITEKVGTAVMYLTYLQWYCKKNDITEMTWDIFTKEVFPDGFPSDEDLHELWVDVKVDRKTMVTNLLDCQTAMKSIQFDIQTQFESKI